MLKELLRENKSAIIEKWVELIFNSYPTQAADFLKNKKNRFNNPVGHTISFNADKILDELIDARDFKEINHLLSDIIKIRAVQSFIPSEAVGFIFKLKDVIREETFREIQLNNLQDELTAVEKKIDTIALTAFDLYMESREKIFKIRISEVKSERLKSY